MAIALHFTTQFNTSYRQAYHSAILSIRSTPTGAEMLRQIEQSARTVTVRKMQDDNSCRAARGDDSCYREVLSNEAFHHALARCATNPSNNRAKWSQAFKKAKIEWREKGPSGPLTIFMRDSTSGVERGKGAYHLMHLLTAGPGADAEVHWDNSREQLGLENVAWNQRPAWVALAHELIHAWRIVTGRCVFHPGDRDGDIYEEYMTVGIPPYDSLPYTENKFRQHAGLAQRRWYSPATQEKSEKAWEKYRSK